MTPFPFECVQCGQRALWDTICGMDVHYDNSHFTHHPVRPEKLPELLREMFAADDAYGCGFYNQQSWLVPYRKLRELIGMPEK